MMITYIDTLSATKKALKDWLKMSEILDAADGKIADIEDRISGISAVSYDRVVVDCSHEMHASFEDGVAEKMLREQAKKSAVEYFAWMLPAWKQLDKAEQYVLDTLYINYELELGVSTIMQRLNASQSAAYRIVNSALQHLATLLFWPQIAA